MDLIQQGNIGLISAIHQYDSTKSIRLATYVSYRINAGMYDYIRMNTTPIKITDTKVHQRIFDNLSKEKKRLEEKGIKFNQEVLAENLNVPIEVIIDLDPLLSPGGVDSLDKETGEVLISHELNPEEQLIENERNQKVTELFDEFRETLRPTQQYIFDNRIIAENPKTLKYIAQITATTKQNIKQMEQVIRGKINEHFNNDEIRNLLNGN